ncbi:hypothetical protein JHK82_050981 [Glycine max]|uniref:Signal peptidase complex subunit 1 n=1 Tax=Glycine soja TaxID=3848 RepID=A0A445FV22_GLYSO|nr:hypothetical protein JHK86_050839 [Glycine max]KAG4925129.1 hypothetical protein JHK87_050669 [Glycine soja]KAG4936762.1 hypothetical protein JHK85_051681 [Glycine max]KAG5092203.1 hypothetical protein JHK82_050981 [Glycine max]KAG5095282.1 hypothetical protein JHK84_050870 [Glycine max]
MDWQGQKITEQLMQLIIVAFAVIAFATGYLMASFQMMILIYVGGVVLTTLDPHICWWCGLSSATYIQLIDPSLCPLKK